MSRESPARRCALEALTEWEDTSRFAADILDHLSRRMRLSPQDRGLAQDLLYGVIRNFYLLDELIERFRRGAIKNQTRNLLRLGLYQLFKTDIAEHAAVNETVSLARQHERSLVNAILRSAQREKAALLAEIESWPLEDRCSHPAFLIDRWTAQYGPEATEALCRWNNEPPAVYARLNPLARDREALERVRSEIEPSLLGEAWPDFFRIEGAPNAEWLRDGFIYVQDPSTSVACRLLDPKPGETILDACAAPGGKSALLAALMGSANNLHVADASESRIHSMRENLERLGIAPASIRQVDWNRSGEGADLPAFDAILIDAPCSNTGVMRRRVDVRWRLDERDFERQAKPQLALVQSLSRLLKPGGRIVYSTCSIDRVENEDVVAASGLKLVETRTTLPWRDGFDGAFAALLQA
ncbi:MAG: 16S rRNA (cytosine(967)-C(5))-methyltransferase RsmB [Verrucomicrobiae bacterium]|nr:16S rRNA (cytosine(967)-C(5))-methyltransferase RsmB [Verrucomicrobiae bacterium]